MKFNTLRETLNSVHKPVRIAKLVGSIIVDVASLVVIHQIASHITNRMTWKIVQVQLID